MSIDLARLHAEHPDLCELIDHWTDEARFLPHVNGAVESTDPSCLAEATRLADALVAIGRAVWPERWYP